MMDLINSIGQDTALTHILGNSLTQLIIKRSGPVHALDFLVNANLTATHNVVTLS